jgi:hypothetical protein
MAGDARYRGVLGCADSFRWERAFPTLEWHLIHMANRLMPPLPIVEDLNAVKIVWRGQTLQMGLGGIGRCLTVRCTNPVVVVIAETHSRCVRRREVCRSPNAQPTIRLE